MTSRRPYCCSKTIKRRPCWCPKPVLWELNSFLMQTLSFVPINLHRCWPREWKHSIVKQYNSVFYWKWSKVQESILRQQIIHGLSSVRKSAGFKIVNDYFSNTFTQLNSIGIQRKQFCLIRARKRRRRNYGYPYWWQITTRPHLSYQGFSVFIADLIHKKILIFFFKDLGLRPTLAVMKRQRNDRT